ncbi:MAG: hypothetical protein AAGK74_09140, partial [Chloroflexota bacterium]
MRLIVTITMAILALLGTYAHTGHAQSGANGTNAFIEENGIVVIEMESASSTPNNWKIGPSGNITSGNINNPGQATGGQYLVWEGEQSLGTPGNST